MKPVLGNILQLIFIRHGEKTTDRDDAGLAKQGQFRADNLYTVFSSQREAPVSSCYNVPDFIFAMQPGHHEDSSTRPLDTVTPLADQMRQDPTLANAADFFNASFKKDDYEDLVQLVTDNAEALYKGKTLLFCWEHKTIPRIVEAFGLSPFDPTEKPLYWGFNPEAMQDDDANYQAIWVINPGRYNQGNFSEGYFEVYSEFSIVPNEVQDKGEIPVDKNVIPDGGFRADEPPGGYDHLHYSYPPGFQG